MRIQLPIGHTLPAQNSASGIDYLGTARRLAMQKLSEVTAARNSDGDKEANPFPMPPVRGHHIDIRC
ncbi:hypothetical protein KKG05_06055 [bacterium]|nr:hypothetical protein [bacterium]